MFMTSEQMTAEQRVQKAIVSIMNNKKYVALAGILMLGERVITEDPSIPTACTNGRDEMYNRDFVDKLNDAELRFLILHESYHKLYRHMTTWKWMADINASEANVCMDFVINIKLYDDNNDGFATMTGELANGCFDEKYRDMDTAQVYHARKKSGEDKEGDGTGIGNPDGNPSDVPSNSSGQGQPFDSHDWDGAKDMTPQEVSDLARDVDEAIRQGALIAGKMGSGGDRDLVELLKPQSWSLLSTRVARSVNPNCLGFSQKSRRYVTQYIPTRYVCCIGTPKCVGTRHTRCTNSMT